MFSSIATALWVLSATSVGAELCVSGPISLTLKPKCSLAALREAYNKVFDDGLMRRPNCNNTLEEDLVELLGTSDLEIGAAKLCTYADPGDVVPFYDIAGMNGRYDSKFDKNYYDGGTSWNEEVETNLETGAPTNVLKYDAARVHSFYNGPAQYGTVEWPGQLSNFDLDTCDIHAAMCCWPSDRQAKDNNGNCATPYDTNCIDKDPADNTDLCATKLDVSPGSVTKGSDAGVSVHPGDNANGEGAVHCHGLAWSNDPNHVTSRYKANNLFYISMYDHLYQRGYVRSFPGAPMCACVEQMPVVTRSDCTQTDLKETYEISCNHEGAGTGCTAAITQIYVDFNACQGIRQNNDLSDYVARLHREGHLSTKQKGALKEILVENRNCPRAIERNLARAGVERGFNHDLFQEVLEFPETDTNQFVHGLCVQGASSVAAYATDTNVRYTQYQNFTSGMQAWGDRDYTLEGVENTVCAGGIFLQPNRHKDINRFTDIVVGAIPIDEHVTICGFVEYNRKRDGLWANQAEGTGYNIKVGLSSGLSWASKKSNANLPMTMLCRELPIQPSSAPSLSPSSVPSVSMVPTQTFSPTMSLPKTITVTLPASTTKQLVHGLCVKGAVGASASSSWAPLTYTAISPFQTGVLAWNDRQYTIQGVENTPCADGIFMKPNRHKSILRNTVITFEMQRDGSDYMDVCVFAEPAGARRNGGWFTSMVQEGFTNYGTEFTEFAWGGGRVTMQDWGMLCKKM